MTDEASFLLVFGLLYLWQCCHWFRPGTITLHGLASQELKFGATDPGFESRLGSPIFLRPWPPFRVSLALSPWPFSVSETGILSFQERCWTPFSRSRQEVRYLALADIKRVEAQGRKILLNSRFFVDAADESTALSHVDFIGDLINLPIEKRADYIESTFRISLDLEAVEERWMKTAHVTRILIRKCQILFTMAIVIMPITFLGMGASGTWFVVLPLLFLLNLITALAFHRAHRQLFPDLASVRWPSSLVMLFFPPETIRAHDHLSRFALTEYHAWPVVQTLASETQASEFFGKLLRDLRHPIPAIESIPENSEGCLQFMRDLEWRLLTEGMSDAEIEVAMKRKEQEGRSCPRCLTPTGAETCDQCWIVTSD